MTEFARQTPSVRAGFERVGDPDTVVVLAACGTGLQSGESRGTRDVRSGCWLGRTL